MFRAPQVPVDIDGGQFTVLYGTDRQVVAADDTVAAGPDLVVRCPVAGIDDESGRSPWQASPIPSMLLANRLEDHVGIKNEAVTAGRELHAGHVIVSENACGRGASDES